jgi:hypothetical protein
MPRLIGVPVSESEAHPAGFVHDPFDERGERRPDAWREADRQIHRLRHDAEEDHALRIAPEPSGAVEQICHAYLVR